MHSLRLTVLFIAALCSHARLSSGVYRLVTGNFEAALADTSNDPQTITAEIDTIGVADQVWSIISNEGPGTATVQNVVTRKYLALNAAATAVVPSLTPYVWNVRNNAGSASIFCSNTGVAGELCISWTFPSNVLILRPFGTIINSGGQTFAPVPTAPPAGWYQIQNLGTGTIITSNGVPGAAVLQPFPASVRSQIWLVTPSGENIPPSFSLSNLANGGFLAVNGTTVGTYGSAPFFWDYEFDDAFLISAQVLQLPNTSSDIIGGPNGLAIGQAGGDRSVAWVFYPVDVNDFLV